MTSNRWRSALGAAPLCYLVAMTGCTADPEPSAFALQFAATADGKDVGCTDVITGQGPDGKQSVGISDLRFYVSNLRFTGADGKAVELELEDNEFQYNSDAGSVALIDMTGNTEGSCSGSAIAFAEGTARTNTVVKGTTVVSKVTSVSFDVGISQPVMKETIKNNTAEGAPSPLNEMFWSWITGYRHFVFNFTVDSEAGDAGGGYLHVGSVDCGPKDGLALEDRDTCGFINTPSVTLSDFDLETGAVQVELPRLLTGLDFIAPIYDMATFEVIGEGPGVECHSSPMQPDCKPIFTSLGLDASTGAADASANEIFSAR